MFDNTDDKTDVLKLSIVRHISLLKYFMIYTRIVFVTLYELQFARPPFFAGQENREVPYLVMYYVIMASQINSHFKNRGFKFFSVK